MPIIAADIGGTNSRLAIIDSVSGKPLHQARLVNRDYVCFGDLLSSFMDSGNSQVEHLYLALPAPVLSDEVKLTNLHWVISKPEIRSRLGIQQITFINDFQAAAMGTTTEGIDQLGVLNDRPVIPEGVRTVTGAGTGLGVSYMHWQHGYYRPFSTEAGHTTFAPVDTQQLALRDDLARRYGHVSYERILSGPGIADIYRHLNGPQAAAEPADAQWVNEQAAAGDSTAQQAMQLFARVFGTFAGNIAVTFKPQGGLYITGGVSAKTAHWISGDGFREAFTHRGRMSELALATPVFLVKNEQVGLQGAIQLALMDIKRGQADD